MEAQARQDAKDRAAMVSLMAAILGTQRATYNIEKARELVTESRLIIDAAYEAEGLPSPFPAAPPSAVAVEASA